jgi:hypothetical protein
MPKLSDYMQNGSRGLAGLQERPLGDTPSGPAAGGHIGAAAATLNTTSLNLSSAAQQQPTGDISLTPEVYKKATALAERR